MPHPEYNITKRISNKMPHLEYFYDPPQFDILKAKLIIKSTSIMSIYWNKTIEKTNFFKYYSLCCYKIMTLYGNNNSVVIIDEKTKKYFDKIIESYNYITNFYVVNFYATNFYSKLITKTNNRIIKFNSTYFNDCETFYKFMVFLKNNLFEYAKNIAKLGG